MEKKTQHEELDADADDGWTIMHMHMVDDDDDV